MKYFLPPPNKSFIGRQRELTILSEIDSQNEASIVVVHGRRRIGKTELIEQFFRNSNLLKFEGLQLGAKGVDGHDERAQIEECVRMLGKYTEQEHVFKNVTCKNWSEFFELLTPYVSVGKIVLYFEELQWLAAYKDDFCARLKPFWDDKWRHNKKLRVVFSGSSPSFLVSQFLGDKALYNRSNHIIALHPFSLNELDEFLGKAGKREKIFAACCVGGVPGYLKRLNEGASIYDALCRESFMRNGYFSTEFSRVFVSSLASNSHYKRVVELLAKNRFLSRAEIVKSLTHGGELGGSLTRILSDLEACGFISVYAPLHLDEGRNLQRYCIQDEFLAFYYSHIKPVDRKIQAGLFDRNPHGAINRVQFDVLLGLSFERWARKNAHIVAECLGFSGIEYRSGAFFNRALNAGQPGFQIDLAFIRRDSTVLIGEIKYGTPPSSVGKEAKEKAKLFIEHNPKYKNYTLKTFLITACDDPLSSRLVEDFDHIITLNDLFTASKVCDRY